MMTNICYVVLKCLFGKLLKLMKNFDFFVANKYYKEGAYFFLK